MKTALIALIATLTSFAVGCLAFAYCRMVLEWRASEATTAGGVALIASFLVIIFYWHIDSKGGGGRHV